MGQLYTVEEARSALADLRPTIVELITLRADATELAAALEEGGSSPLGGRAELKAAEAWLDETLTSITATGIHVKGIAPLLLDFPSELDGVSVLLCWLEGEAELGWYHRVELGFAGRRRLPGAE